MFGQIVSFGDPSVLPTKMVGKYVKPRVWNALISDPDTVGSLKREIHLFIHLQQHTFLSYYD